MTINYSVLRCDEYSRLEKAMEQHEQAMERYQVNIAAHQNLLAKYEQDKAEYDRHLLETQRTEDEKTLQELAEKLGKTVS